MSEAVRDAIEAVRAARLGEAMGERLVACARALEDAGNSSERYEAARAVRLALFGGPRREDACHVITAEAARYRHAPVEIVGLRFREGDPLDEPFGENPWGIASAGTLGQAIDSVWGPVRDRASTLVRHLHKRLIGLVNLRDAKGAPVLGYLIYVPGRAPPPQELAFDRRRALDWESHGDVSMFFGRAPCASPTARSGVVLPEPLRAFYGVHGAMEEGGFGTWSISSPEDVIVWSDMLDHTEPTTVDSEDEEETVDSDELLGFFSYGDDRSDLFELTGDDDPPVREWFEGMLETWDEKTFFPWLNAKAALFLRMPARG